MAAFAFRSAAPKSGFAFTSFVGNLATWNDRRVTRHSLHQLSTRQLEDIGLNRADIESVVQGDLIR